MIKIFKHDGKSFEGNFVPVPGKANYGHLMVGGQLLYTKTEDGQQGAATVFSCASGDEVKIADDNFKGFFNMKGTSGSIKAKVMEKAKTIVPQVNISDDLSEKAKEVIIAIKKYAQGDYFWVKDVTGYSNVLYGYVDSFIKKGIIARTGEKDKERGAKFKILK